MKKWILLVFSLLFFVGMIVVSFFVEDRTKPTIEIKGTPSLDCNCNIDNLLDYAYAKDDNLKSFYIKEDDISEIANNKYVTCIAIDKSNNVSEMKMPIEISSDFENYHIEKIKEFVIQVGERFDINDYFVVKNVCGYNVNGKLSMSDVDLNSVGTYEVKIESTNFNCKPIIEIFKIIDEYSPVITLKQEEITVNTNSYWNENDFIEYIDTITDDIDDRNYLLEKLYINWKEVLNPNENGFINKIGSYDITYTVTDSDERKGKAVFMINFIENDIVNE